ncbi:hypothetical protein FACS1894172_19270 [Spirochaetia bacterium]|nr:hypothetical protein FACS1894164_19220 [Spirochaetia bacterium]GHU36404.1 hypothetical protein FACS1894172_19270 [Spirochaetia bacterium]
MIDTHIHIGQFREIFYNPSEIIQIISDSGIKGCVYSSTTSCKDGVKYHEIQKEIEGVISHFSPSIFKPYLWFIPSYKAEGINIEDAMNDIPYKGIKIHPYANDWTNNIPKNNNILHELFEYASDFNIPILIHTGENGKDAPNTFEYFFNQYPKAKCILAHCRPVLETIEMFRTYKNVYGDTAFLSKANLQKIIQAGFADRILLGSDFPITHYFSQRQNEKITLQNRYNVDKSTLEGYKELIGKDEY